MWIWTRGPGRFGNNYVLGRWMVDTWEVVSDKNLEALSCNAHLRAGSQSVAWQHQYHSLFAMPGMIESRISMIGNHPLCVYYLSTWRHVTRYPRPSLSPPYLHTARKQRLEMGWCWNKSRSHALWIKQTIICVMSCICRSLIITLQIVPGGRTCFKCYYIVWEKPDHHKHSCNNTST